MWFYLPPDISVAPAPLNKDVVVQQLPVRTEIVYQFSGDAHEDLALRESAAQHVGELISSMSLPGEADTHNWFAALYNPPWTPVDERTNEIHVPLVAPVVSETSFYAAAQRDPYFAAHRKGEIPEPMPEYDLVYSSKNRGYDIRQYWGDVIATTPLNYGPQMLQEMDQGFYRLVDYFGIRSTPKNTPGVSMDMTVPVGLTDGE
eukprot:Selendium_serpulae@DN1438_c0_g1_i1.p1